MRTQRAVLAAIVLALALPGAAQAATFTVNSTQDLSDSDTGDGVCAAAAGACTLRAAIEQADDTTGADTVRLPAATFNVTGDNFDVSEDLTITGAGSALTVIDASAMEDDDALFRPDFAGDLTLQDLTITGSDNTNDAAVVDGYLAQLTLRGAVVENNEGEEIIELGSSDEAYAATTVLLDHSRVSGNRAGEYIVELDPEGGGALILRDSEFSDNVVDSDAFSQEERSALAGTRVSLIEFSPYGGDAVLTIERSRLEGNRIENSYSEGVINFEPENEGPLESTIRIVDSTFKGNELGDSGIGALRLYPRAYGPGTVDAEITRSRFEANRVGVGGEGKGGAIAFKAQDQGGSYYPTLAEGDPSTELKITDSSFVDNVAGETNGGAGGAIRWSPSSDAATLTIRGTTFSGNRSGSPDANNGASGGALDFDNGVLDVVNSTFTGNRVGIANWQSGGGAIRIGSRFAEATLTNVTVADNHVAEGYGGGILGPFMLIESSAAADDESPVVVTNSIVAGNTAAAPEEQEGRAALAAVADDCAGLVYSGGHNLESAKTCRFTETGDKQDTDPKLAALADNGGPTATRAIASDSPAFDAGNTATCAATDQRGVTRPQFARCDIGAFELAPVPPPAQPAKPAQPAPTGAVAGESARRCVSRRAFSIRLRVPRGVQVRRATVWVNGKKVAVRRGNRLTAAVNLRNLPPGRFTVRIVISLRGGGVIKGSRHYHTCRKAIPPKKVPKV